jgi:Zn-dependent M28 family amino/carboxypeptidase
MRNTSRDLPQTRSANVIGELPGTDPDPEIVLLGAHLDSWDPGTGAQDDGAGVAIVVGAVKAVMDAGLKPRRTLRVVLFANEEFGLSGATKYAQIETERLARHALAMEADTGAGPVYRVDTLLPEQRLGLGAEILHVVKSLGVEAGGNQASGGADLRPLKTAGVPILDLELDATYYFDVHHTANDTLNQVDPKKLAQSTSVHAVAAWLAGSEPSATKPAAPQPPPAR